MTLKRILTHLVPVKYLAYVASTPTRQMKGPPEKAVSKAF
jgi:hypothetical protein